MTDQTKFIIKVFLALAAASAGWLASTFGTEWHAASLTPVAVAGLLTIITTVLGGIFGITTPSAARAVDVALLPGVHTQDDVKKVLASTEPGTVPTPEVAAAILKQP